MIRRPVAASVSLASWKNTKPASETLAAASRPGVTLIEVLVAIMITGVGLLALLTLFPLGALEMAQSFKDDRCGHVKHNAAAVANAWNIRQDPNVQAGMLNPPNPALPSFYVQGSNPPQVQPGLANVQSYPVFVDPAGYWANYNASGGAAVVQFMAPGSAGFVVPQRVTFNPLTFPGPDANFNPGGNWGYVKQQLRRYTSFLDDMTFPRDDPSGIPEGRPCIPLPGSAFDRGLRYSWAYVCRITKAGNPTLVELAVVVYSGRQLSGAVTGEKPYNATFNGTVATLTWGAGQTTPDVVTGTWIFDATMQPDPHGYFYRVLSATLTSANSMTIEVQTPFRNSGPGTVIVMDNVIEVFERGTN